MSDVRRNDSRALGLLRWTSTTGTPAAGLLPTDLAARDGRLVLLQFSSAFSRSCRDTHSVLDDVAAELPGLVHRDVDLATRP